MKKIREMKLSDYFEIKRPCYCYISVIPHKGVRNFNSSNITRLIALSFKSIIKRLYKEKKKRVFETNFKFSFVINIQNNNASFVFIVPKMFKNQLKEKISEIWYQATVNEIEGGLGEISPNSFFYQISTFKEDAMSLSVDKKANTILNSVLANLDVIKEENRLMLIANFMPSAQFQWINMYEETMQKIKEKKPLEKPSVSLTYIFKTFVTTLMSLLDNLLSVLNDFTGTDSNKPKESLYDSILGVLEEQRGLSPHTKKKRDSLILPTQLLAISDDEDLARSLCMSTKVIDEDNELVYKRKKYKKFNIEDYSFNTAISILSTDEASEFVKIPGKQLCLQHKLTHIATTETDIPKELQQGVACLGESTSRGSKSKVYLTSDKNLKNLCLCVIGATRGGKTTFLANLSKNFIDNNECVILFDFCGECEFSSDVSSVINKNRILDIDCSNLNKLEGLGYSEVKPKSDSPFDIYNCTKIKTQQLMTLINSVNGDKKLEPRMERYLECASLVTFICNGSIKDIITVLSNHTARASYINRVPKNQFENMEEYILSLQELDEWSRGTKDCPSEIIGTKIASVQGILNRVNKLKSNAYMELMYKKDCSNNINLIEEMQKSQLICLRMPESMFTTESEKDIYCTYWLTRIWGALQVRHEQIRSEKDRVKVNIFFDELYQVPSCTEFLRSKLSQIAKKTCKPIISCHYLKQMPIIRDELKSANTSYMLLSSCDKDNYNELKEELEPFELDDILNLKRFHSLNLIRYEKGWCKCVTALPEPIK